MLWKGQPPLPPTPRHVGPQWEIPLAWEEHTVNDIITEFEPNSSVLSLDYDVDTSRPPGPPPRMPRDCSRVLCRCPWSLGLDPWARLRSGKTGWEQHWLFAAPFPGSHSPAPHGSVAGPACRGHCRHLGAPCGWRLVAWSCTRWACPPLPGLLAPGQVMPVSGAESAGADASCFRRSRAGRGEKVLRLEYPHPKLNHSCRL